MGSELPKDIYSGPEQVPQEEMDKAREESQRMLKAYQTLHSTRYETPRKQVEAFIDYLAEFFDVDSKKLHFTLDTNDKEAVEEIWQMTDYYLAGLTVDGNKQSAAFEAFLNKYKK